METNSQNDDYAKNLAKVNEISHVMAASDICNAQGQIIAKKGTRIDKDLAERITRFKLLRPLENSVVIENELDARTLMECFASYLQSDVSTAFFFQKYYKPETLLKLCERVCAHPVMRQKITVMSLIMPAIFEQAMFCAWFGYLMTIRYSNNPAKAEDLFIAGMCHDLGMIHISEEILNKPGELTPEEWRQIHVHPIIGYNVLKEIPGMSKNVARAVLEHHESIDGTGYPKNKTGTNLCIEGQVLNLLDSLNAIYNKRFKPFHRPLSDTIPILQISRHSRFGPLGKKLIVLLREMPRTKNTMFPEEHLSSITETLQAHGEYIRSCVDIANDMVKKFDTSDASSPLHSIENSIVHISISILQSGVINDAYMRWLDQVASNKLDHAYKEVEEAYLMMQEIIYQISHLKNLVSLYLTSVKSSNDGDILSERVLQLNVQSRPAIQPPLSELWLFSA